jgi:HlyD family secretion protein
MRIIVSAVLIALAVAGGGWYLRAEGQKEVNYRTGAVQRGDVVATISATGTLEPEEVIDVGAQVEGLIVSFGKDTNGQPIDYRSPVEPDMVLARIDDAVYKADVDTGVAELEQANAAVLKGQADLDQANAKLLQAQNSWNRAKVMGPSDALSQNDYEMYQADYETAKANVAVADAECAQAKSGVSLAQASLAKAQRNLEFCTIRSPVKGVIIDRRVNIGQTVVSSLNAPSLFLLAQDLTQMQIWVAVNEADVGRIKPGSPVTFTCDAYPDQIFQGRVGKVRLNAAMTQNVVMYTVEVEADNSDGILLPYLTANVLFQIQKDTDTLMVPNAALRWTPASASQISPGALAAAADGPAPDSGHAADPPPGHSHYAKNRRGTIWIRDGRFVRPIDVAIGVSDGLYTAVKSDALADGTEVVTGEISQSDGGGSNNPFLPQIPRH